MSSTDRQNRLLVAEDWKRIYQSYRNADFQSYDFDNLRRVMINYIRENYPEDFNDYIESSEYLALIDLIAFLGQNISYRIDLNARENFLELAERRESVLRLARLLSYNPKRNQPANGLLKISSVQTTEEIFDANNVNLENQTILWNDPSNPDWNEQFTKVLNSSLPINGTYGRPVKKDTVNGIPTEQYRFNSTNTEVPVFGFSKVVNGTSTRFEIVSTDVTNGNIQEEAPFPGNNFAFLYRDDGRGPASTNNGFFCHFRQGTLDQGTFSISTPSTNQVVAIDAVNINNNDVWLYKLDGFGLEDEQWSKVDAVEGNNVIYNSLSKKVRNIYSVLTRINDRISLIFSDGVFGNLPKGNFRVYYRTSKNQRQIVEPADMRGVSIKVPYVSRKGKSETLSIVFELGYTVDNATTSETNGSIKNSAPANYYTQNRMVTAEDYQIGPLTVNQEIVKAKSVNRISSGISRYFDLTDATGKYSKTNLFGIDGIITKEKLDLQNTFTFATQTDIEGAIENIIEPILTDRKVKNFYMSEYPQLLTEDLNNTWTSLSNDTNLNTGYLQNNAGVKSQIGTFTGSLLKLIVPGTLIKFIPPTGKHFMSNDDYKLMDGAPTHPGAVSYKWTKVVSVTGDGTTVNIDGSGSVVLADPIPTDAKLVEIMPRIATALEDDVKTQIVDQAFAYKTFGLRFDRDLRQWRLITENDLNVGGAFSIGKTGDSTNQQLDASWLLLFETDGETYTITYRASRYVFESDKEIKFYYDSGDKIYNNLTGKTVKDKVRLLSINTQPKPSTSPFTVDFDWEIVEEFRDSDGYINSKKIQVSFFDEDEDGVVDNPQIFEDIVAPKVTPLEKNIFLEKVSTNDGSEDYNYIDNSARTQPIVTLQNLAALRTTTIYLDQQVFYFVDENVFYKLDKTTGNLSLTNDYRARIGRDKLKFLYVHAADASSRIDPSVSNIIDTYLLTRSYDNSYRQYLEGTLANKPLPPSQDQLFQSYGSDLNKIKSLTDEIIYHPAKYKVLFGSKAKDDLQATFKIVKNADLSINDNDLKSRVIGAINEFFALENWEFGETFYFTELSAYVMQKLAPDLVMFVLVPDQTSQTFGSLFEIKSESDEIFISGATVDDIEIVDAITASRLKAQGNVLTSSTTANTGIQSSSSTTTTSTSSSSSSSSSSGGSAY